MKTLYRLIIIILITTFFNIPLYADKILTVYKYKQCGPWGSTQLGNCPGQDICHWGCALAAISMLLKTNGTNADPGNVNTFMNTNNYWSGGCVMDWINACRFPGATMHWTSSPAYLFATVKTQIDANKPVIVRVLLPSEHFIVVFGYLGDGTSESQYQVYDPLEDNVKTLNLYNKHSLRLFDGVINNSQMTFTLKINESLFPAPPNEYTIYKFPPIPQNYYRFTVEVANRNGNTYDIYMIIPNRDSISIAQNVDLDLYTEYLAFDSTSSLFPSGGGYKIKIYKNDPSGTLWATSQPFYVCTLPRVIIDPIPGVLYFGNSETVTFHLEGGNIWKPNHGWTGHGVVELYQNSTWVQVLGSPQIGSGTCTFNVPSHIGTMHRVSISNPPGSSIPPNYVYAYTNYTEIQNPIGIIPISEIVPLEYKLHNNYPNPFNPMTNIKFDIPKDGLTRIKVYDVLGNLIDNLINEELKAGTYEIQFDGSNLASGIYFYTIKSNDFVETNKMILTK